MKSYFNNKPYFYAIKRDEAIALLKDEPIKTFLLRPSERYPDCLAFSTKTKPTEVGHALIKQKQDGMFFVENSPGIDKPCKSLDELISNILLNGFTPLLPTAELTTNLFNTIEKNDLPNLQQLLKHRSVDLCVNDTPIIGIAAKKGQIEIVRWLIQQGADLNAQSKNKDSNGYTALMFAAENGDSNMVIALLKAGAKKTLANMADKTAFELASSKETSEHLITYHARMERIGQTQIIPKYLLCPITFELMEDPVSLTSGHTFERRALISHWRSSGSQDVFKCPITKKDIQKFELETWTNIGMKDATENFVLQEEEKYRQEQKMKEKMAALAIQSGPFFKQSSEQGVEYSTTSTSTSTVRDSTSSKEINEPQFSARAGSKREK